MKSPARSLSLLLRAGALGMALARLIRPGAPPLGPSDGSGRVGISVVVPARNEAERIERTIGSALAAHDVGRVIVVDDNSEDDTAHIAAQAGAEVVSAGPRPSGWAGKTWALQRGVAAVATGWVIALDADVTIDPALPRRMVERAVADGGALLSVAPRFRSGTTGGEWLHASMLATLVYRFGRPGSSGASLVSGQCLAFDAAAFLDWGGYEPVAGSVIEDVALARWLVDRGRVVSFVDGGGLLMAEPYPSFGATWSGWGRSLGLPTVDSIARRVGDLVVLALALPLPIVRVVARRADIVDAAAIVLRLGVLVGTAGAYPHRRPSYWMSPLADVVSIASLVCSLTHREQRWRGRIYANR